MINDNILAYFDENFTPQKADILITNSQILGVPIEFATSCIQVGCSKKYRDLFDFSFVENNDDKYIIVNQ